VANNYKSWIPLALLEHLRPIIRRGIYFSGSYVDWISASKESSGYDAGVILEKVKHATLQVMAGKAVYERDSVLFDEEHYSFPLLAGLLRAANEDGGKLSVLDFGGSLGSSYFQCRNFLSIVKDLQWCVVEQPHFVRCGREHIESRQLKFYFDVDEATNSAIPNVILLASVLQYLPKPYEILDRLTQTGARYLIIDRTPFSNLLHDLITVQHVPPEIYPASYACRVFSKSNILERLSEQFELLSEFENEDGGAVTAGTRFTFGGLILRRK